MSLRNQPNSSNDHLDNEPPLRCAIYARYSSEMQNELSIDDQISRCREEVGRRGWRVAGIYSDSRDEIVANYAKAIDDLIVIVDSHQT